MNLILTFTFLGSLKTWNDTGSIYREVALYKKLMERNIDTIFLTYGDENDLNYSDILDGIKIIPIKNLIKTNKRRIAFLKSLFIPFKLKSLFKNIDIVKTNQLEGSWVGWFAKIFYRKKFVVRGGFEWLKFYILQKESINNGKNLNYWLKYLWRYLIEFISYKLADKIILTNPDDVEFIIKKFKLKREKYKIQHSYNYIDIDLFKPSSTIKKDKHVLYIGRLNQQKNINNLFKAFIHLQGFDLDIIGNISNENPVIDKIKQFEINVNFLGTIPNNILPEIINQYQIFILPSFYEGNPKVLLEAMGCGLACIGTNVWGINNIINHKENGYLCKTDSKSIKNAILTVYNDQSLRNKMGKNARNFIIKNCSLNLIAEKEYLCYREIFHNK